MDTDGEFLESVSHSCSENINIKPNTGVFECNICLDSAEVPVVTLCGHLFCGPCLKKWLQFHSHRHECPVCKALVDVNNLVPIYGRGTSSSDPVSSSDIPSRPASQRPQTAPAPELTYSRQHGSVAPGGFWPIRMWNWTTALFSQRPQTAPAPELTYFRQHGSGAPAGFWPLRMGDWTTAILNAISSVLESRLLDFHDMPRLMYEELNCFSRRYVY